MKAKKHRRCRVDPFAPLPDWDSDFWIGVLTNAISLERRIDKAKRQGNWRRARYLQRVFDHSLVPRAIELIFENEFQDSTGPGPQPSAPTNRP